MAHHSADCIQYWLAQQGQLSPTLCALDANTAAKAKNFLKIDARGLLYSSTLSFLSAIEGVRGASFSWAIVKLYYSCFYAARSILAFNDTCVFYNGTKPYSIMVTPGAFPRKENGVTHKVVWSLFSREFPNNVLLNDVDGVLAHNWMTGLRETANYKNAKFPDPLVPNVFNTLDRRGISEALTAYHTDLTDLLTFDKDHAAVAFPLKCINQAKRAFARSGGNYDQDDLDHIIALCEKIEVNPEIFILT